MNKEIKVLLNGISTKSFAEGLSSLNKDAKVFSKITYMDEQVNHEQVKHAQSSLDMAIATIQLTAALISLIKLILEYIKDRDLKAKVTINIDKKGKLVIPIDISEKELEDKILKENVDERIKGIKIDVINIRDE